MNTITEKLYYKDSHLKEFTASVLDVRKKDSRYAVLLDRTAFFPEGGGQPADTGFLNDIPVVDVQEENEKIYHYLENEIEVNSSITGKINWSSRFSSMQNHSGEHIVSGLVHKIYGYDNVGFHMGSESITMDFSGILTTAELRYIETMANEAVYKNIPVIQSYPSKEELQKLQYRSKKEISGQVRIVTIPFSSEQREPFLETYDVCACCAPHVKHTGEIGIIRLLSSMKYKGGTRVSMLCGLRALQDIQKKEENNTIISNLLSTKPYGIAKAVQKEIEEVSSLKGKISSLYKELIEFKLKELPKGMRHYCLFETNQDADILRSFCNRITESCDGVAAIFSKCETGYHYIISSRNIDVRIIGIAFNQAFFGRGGGKTQMVQGTITGTEEDIKDFFEEQTQDY